MHGSPPPTPLTPGASSSYSSPSLHDSRNVSFAEHATRSTAPESSIQPSTSDSGSSLSKFLQFSSGNIASPSSHSHGRTPDTPLTAPSLEHSVGAEQSKHVPSAADADFFCSNPSTSPSLSSSPPPPPPPSVQGTQSSASMSSSSNEQLPTRASIRAWAQATPAGPPCNTPSPARSPQPLQSSSDERLDRRSITRSTGDPTASSESLSGSDGSGSRSESGSGSGVTSADEDNSSRNSLFPGGDSSGNVADIESAGSPSPEADASDASHPSPSPSPTSSSPPNHPALGPPSQSSQSSESESPPPALVVSHTHRQNQQDRLDRRHQRHLPAHPGRRRERHRDRRSRTSPHNPVNSTPAAQTQTQAGRVVPEVRAWLPPPPPPLPPLRPLQLMTGGFDVLDEITRMLHSSRRPILRAGDHHHDDGRYAQRRRDDVLDDICYMITMSRSSE